MSLLIDYKLKSSDLILIYEKNLFKSLSTLISDKKEKKEFIPEIVDITLNIDNKIHYSFTIKHSPSTSSKFYCSERFKT